MKENTAKRQTLTYYHQINNKKHKNNIEYESSQIESRKNNRISIDPVGYEQF